MSRTRLISGRGFEIVEAVATDRDGNVYVAGSTGSADFRTRRGFQDEYKGCTDISCSDGFVAKFDSRLRPQYVTLIGGRGDRRRSGRDYVTDVAVDAGGNAYITGSTGSPDFPTTTDAVKSEMGPRDPQDAFIAKISPGGRKLLYASFLGGTEGEDNPGAGDVAGDDLGNAIFLEDEGIATVVGSTDATDFPTKNPTQTTTGGGVDAFVSRIDTRTGELLYSSYLGGESGDTAKAVTIVDGDIAVAGSTSSAMFPSLSAIQPVNRGESDAFVTRLDPTDGSLVHSTFLGGGAHDDGWGIGADAAGAVYLTGVTESPDFPTTPVALQTARAGEDDAFVAKIGASGQTLEYSTLIGGGGRDRAYELTVTPGGNATITGITGSSDFPTRRAIQRNKAAGFDAFVLTLDAGGSALEFSSFLGGDKRSELPPADSAYGVSRRGHRVFVVGVTKSRDFPGVTRAQRASGSFSELEGFVSVLRGV